MAEQKVYGAAAVMARTGTYTLSKEKVAQKWNYIVEGGAGRGKWVIDTTKEFIHEANIPGVFMEEADVSMGMFREKRPFLVTGLNAHRDYRMFISARDFGVHLAYSTAKLPPIPGESCHQFHGKAATCSTRKLPLIP